jgi:hypothetical protein
MERDATLGTPHGGLTPPGEASIREFKVSHMATAPRRSRSVEAMLWQPRVTAILALIVLIAGIVSDEVAGDFWLRHALLASVAGSVIVVLLSVAVINEMIERRRRGRWSILAQYVMFELVRNARMIWLGVAELAGLLSSEGNPRESVDAGRQVVRDTSRLTEAVRDVLSDVDRGASLRSEVAFLAEHADEVLGRWAAVMLASEVYAEVIDRHVELGGDVGWVAGLFDVAYPPSDPRRRKRARSTDQLVGGHRPPSGCRGNGTEEVDYGGALDGGVFGFPGSGTLR